MSSNVGSDEKRDDAPAGEPSAGEPSARFMDVFWLRI
jgi:hypothetical protein